MNLNISGYKDTDVEILLNLPDKDLLAACSVNKYLFENVCNDSFFHKKLLRTYPNTLKYDLHIKSCKQYYLKVVYYVTKMKEMFNYSYINGNPEKQYNIFKNSFSSKTLLEKSSARGECELVKEAIKRGADIHVYDEIAVKLAVQNGHLDIVKYLVSLGCNIHKNDSEAFELASLYGHVDIMKYIVILDPYIPRDIKYALDLAVEHGHGEVVQYLSSL